MGGKVEPDFGTAHDERWQLVFHQFPQDYFLTRALDFEMRGKRCGELDDAVIEKRRTYLDGVGHAHAVDLHEYVVGKKKFLVEAEERIEARIRGRGISQQAIERGGQGLLDQFIFLAVGKGSVPESMAAKRRQQATGEKALELVFEADVVVGDGE